MKKFRFFAALCCAAAVFAACEKNDEPKSGNQNNNNSPIENPDTQYTLTVLSNDETLGTITGSGKYAAGTVVSVVVTPKQGFELASWSDTNTNDLEREILLVSDSTITATFRTVTTGTENSHDWVNLGLPSGTKWATCNVGADKPEEYGNYYAWGETATKEYTWKTYKYGSDYYQLTKYCTDAHYGKDGFTDGKNTLEADDDAASVNWGGAWRMPTDAEWTELREQCDWTWTDNYNGTDVTGRIVTSKTNGNSIFLPAAGYRGYGRLYDAGSTGYYWSSSLCADGPGGARDVYFHSLSVSRYFSSRCYGLSVRAVLVLE